MKALLSISNEPATVSAAAAAVEKVLKAASSEGAQVAACQCLATLAAAPGSVTISGCTFENRQPVRRRRGN